MTKRKAAAVKEPEPEPQVEVDERLQMSDDYMALVTDIIETDKLPAVKSLDDVLNISMRYWALHNRSFRMWLDRRQMRVSREKTV